MRRWPTWAKWLVSVGLALHLAATLAAALGNDPASPLERAVAGLFASYYQATGLTLSHRYYAEGAPPTPVVTARLTMADGSERSIRIPDRSARPRLLYQRQLALAYHLSSDFDRRRNDPHGAEASPWGASYARHLCRSNPGCRSVTLQTQLHLNPALWQIREAWARPGGGAPDVESESYYTVPDRIGEYPCAD